MKKYYILFALFSFLLLACMEDESNYDVQEKEDVNVEENQPGGPNGEEDSLALKPGMNKVFLHLPGERVELRAFKYYFPMSIRKDKPISLVFNFHGSYTFEEGAEVPDPLLGLSSSQIMCKIADTANYIVVFPAGTVPVINGNPANAVNWQSQEEHFPFFDAMVEYFKKHTPYIDANRIYSCGHSSGAIFSFGLAMKRSEIVAAVTPVSGQYALGDDFVKPARVVPVRAFNGMKDDAVNYPDGAVNNIKVWAEKVADYYGDLFLSQSLTIDDYKIQTTEWHGGRGDIELYGIEEEGHSVNWTKIGLEMWKFMRVHPLNATPALSLTLDKNKVVVEKGQTVEVGYKMTPGTTMTITSPEGWTVVKDDSKISFTAPVASNTDAVSEGKVTFELSNTIGDSRTFDIEVKAIQVYDLGDIFYVYEAGVETSAGVVFELSADKQSGKMVAFDEWSMIWGKDTLLSGLTTDDGLKNTLKIVQDLASWTVTEYAAKKCSAYREGESWYLPSRDEFEKLNDQWQLISTALGSKMLKQGEAYWTSSQKDKDNAYTLIGGDGYFGGKKKSEQALVRPVRQF